MSEYENGVKYLGRFTVQSSNRLLIQHRESSTLLDKEKKMIFWPFFCCFLFGYLLTYPNVCLPHRGQQANVKRR